MLIVAVAFLCLFYVSADAHSGRTDARGGHYDKSTGEYHYHHGFPAHQHTGGVCPYDFIDQTGSFSGGSSTSSDREELQKVQDSSHAASVEEKEGISALEWVLIIGLAATSWLFFFLYRDAKSKNRAAEQLQAEAERKINNARSIYHDAENVYNDTMLLLQDQLALQGKAEDKKAYKDMRCSLYAKYNAVPFRSVFPAPAGLELSEYGIPVSLDGKQDALCVYVTQHGTKYHRKGCKSLTGKYTAVFLWNVPRGTTPCAQCNPASCDFSWYEAYMAERAALARYGYIITVRDGVIFLQNRTWDSRTSAST